MRYFKKLRMAAVGGHTQFLEAAHLKLKCFTRYINIFVILELAPWI
jgi:hypothetical protein